MLRSACHENFVASFEWVARIIPGGKVERLDGLTAVRTGMPQPDFNILFALEPPESPSLGGIREWVDRLFVRSNTRFQVITTSETMDAMRPLVMEMGLTERRDVPGMILDPLPSSCPDPPEDLQIRTLTRAREVDDYLRTATSGFGIPQDYFDAWTLGLRGEVEERTFPGANYLGFVRGRPVATSLRYTTGRVAGIYMVSTAPEFRRRGLGEAMTWRAAVDGRVMGEACDLSYLQASPMGRPVYERMGYRLLEWYQEWNAPSRQREANQR